MRVSFIAAEVKSLTRCHPVLPFRSAPASRFRIASLLLALEHGTHVNSPIAEFVECVAYRLEPMTEGSFNDLDGEAVESGPIQGKVEPAAIRVFCTPIAAP